VSVAELLVTPADVAVTFDVPVPIVVARPFALIVATAVAEEFHVAVPVKFWVLLSENVPIAANCCVKPFATEGFVGVTAIDANVAGVTVSVALLLVTPLDVAVMFDVPVASVVAKPAELIVATEVVAEFHVALLVKF
jgi:hypothetical protein